MARASFSTLPLDILHCLAFYIHPPDLLSFILTCKATSLLEVSGHAIRLHRQRLSKCRSIDNEKELTLTELLCKCIKNPWAGYYIKKLDILHGRDSWDSEWIESLPRHYTGGDPQEAVRSYLRLNTDAAVAAAKTELPTHHSSEQLELLEEAVLKARFIVDEEKLSWMEEIKLGSEVPIIALLLPRLTMLKSLLTNSQNSGQLRCLDPLSLQRLNQILHRITLDPSCRHPSDFRSLKELHWENSAEDYSLVTSVLPLMTLPALRKLTVDHDHWPHLSRNAPTLRDEDDESANWALGSISPKLSFVKLEYAKMSLTWISRLLGSLKSLNSLEIVGGVVSDLRFIQYGSWMPNISESVSDLSLTSLDISKRSLTLLLCSCRNLKQISLSNVDITSDIGSDDIDCLDLKSQLSSLCDISLRNTHLSLETLDTLIAFAKQLRKFTTWGVFTTSRKASHQIRLSPEQAIKLLQIRASDTLQSLSLQEMKPIDALSVPSLRNFHELSHITITDRALFGEKVPELYHEPEKQDAWLAMLPPLSEILPASLKSLNIISEGIPTVPSAGVERLSAVRPWSIRLAEHFENNYATTPCLSKVHYNVYGKRYRGRHSLGGIPEEDRLEKALMLHRIVHPITYDGFICRYTGIPIRRQRRKINSPFEPKIISANTA